VFAEPARTPYDLNFRLFGFPVRIHPLFWLGTVLLGSNLLQGDNGLLFLAIWIVVVFVSILVHEFGHGLAYRRYGSHAHVILWMFGGLAVGSPDVHGRGRRIIVALAGPAAGFVLCGLVYGSHILTDWGNPRNGPAIGFLYFALIFVNLVWGVFNLLPVFPLDGWLVSREVCDGLRPGRGLALSLKVSIAAGAVVAIYSAACELGAHTGGPLEFIPWWARGTWYTAILFAVLAVQSYLVLQQVGPGVRYDAPDDRVPWER